MIFWELFVLLEFNQESSLALLRAVASLSPLGGEDKNMSSIVSHFPVGSLIFSSNFLHFLPHFGLPGGSSSTREGSAYATGSPAIANMIDCFSISRNCYELHNVDKIDFNITRICNASIIQWSVIIIPILVYQVHSNKTFRKMYYSYIATTW